MVNCRGLMFAFVLLSLSPACAFSQDRSDAYLDEQIQKRIDEVEKNLREIQELIKLRSSETKAISWASFGVSGKTVSKEDLPEPYTGGVEITKIEAGSEAEAMGLRVGDLIVFAATNTPTLEELVRAVEKLNSQGIRFPKIVFMRDGQLFVTSRLSHLGKK